MKKLLIGIFLLFAALLEIAHAGEKIAVQSWMAELNGQVNEAYTVNGPQSSFGMFCSGEQCLFYLRQSLNCTPGAKYSVLMNSANLSTTS